MAKQIKRSDIAEKDLYRDIRKSAEDSIATVEILNEEIGKTADILLKKLKKPLDVTAEGLKELAKNSDKLNDIMKKSLQLDKAKADAMKAKAQADKALAKLQKEKIKQEKDKAKAMTAAQKLQEKSNRLKTEEAKKEQELKLKIQEQNKALKDSIKADKAKNGSLNKLEVALRQNILRYKSLSKEERENTKVGKDLLKTIKQQDKEVKQLNESIGRSQGSVGDYGKALRGVSSILGGLGLSLGGGAALTGLFRFNKNLAEAERLSRSFFDINEEGIKSISKDAVILSKVYEKEVNEVLSSANVLQKEFGVSGENSLKLIEQGFEKGLDSSGEFLNNIREYSSQLRLAGLSAEESFALISETERQGVFSDKGIDAIKEATLSLREMTLPAQEALQAIGMTADQVQKDIESGNKTYFEVIQEISRKTAEFGDESREAGLILADVFKGAGEDAGQFIFKLGDLNGSLDDIDSTLSPFQQSFNDLQKSWNEFIFDINEGVGVGNALTNVFRFLAGNLKSIVKIVVTGGIAWVSYKVGVVGTNLALKIYNKRTLVLARNLVRSIRGIKGANLSFKALNATMKANIIGAVVSAITTLITAFNLFSDSADDAADAQDEFNKSQEDALSGIDKRFAIRKKLSKEQIENLKSDINEQIALEKERAVKTESFQNDLTDVFIRESKERIKALKARGASQSEIDLENKLLEDTIRFKKQDIEKDIEKTAQQLKLERQLKTLNGLKLKDVKVTDVQLGLIQQLQEKIKKLREEQNKSLNEDVIKQKQREIEITQKQLDALTDLTEAQEEYNTAIMESVQAVEQDDFDFEIEMMERNFEKAVELGEEGVEELKMRLDEQKKLMIERLRDQAEFDKKMASISIKDEDEKAQKIKEINSKLANDIERINLGITDKKKELDEKEIESEEEKAAKLKDKQAQRLEDALAVQQQLTDAFVELTDRRIAKIDEEIAASERRFSTLQDLAAEGNITAKESLAEEARLLAEQNRKKEQLERRKQRIELASSVLEAYQRNTADESVTNPLAKTITDTVLLTEFIKSLPAFYEGTEDTGKHGEGVDGKGGFFSILHPNERVMPKEYNSMTAGMSNEDLATLAYKYQSGLITDTSDFKGGMAINDNSLVIKELQDLKRTIKNKPETNIELEQIISGAMVVKRTTSQGNTKVYNRYRV